MRSVDVARKDPKRFGREAMAHLERLMGERPRPVHAQKGPLGIGVRESP
jgi:hypothetical protein